MRYDAQVGLCVIVEMQNVRIDKLSFWAFIQNITIFSTDIEVFLPILEK